MQHYIDSTALARTSAAAGISTGVTVLLDAHVVDANWSLDAFSVDFLANVSAEARIIFTNPTHLWGDTNVVDSPAIV